MPKKLKSPKNLKPGFKLKIKLKNRKLALLALIGFLIFTGLGIWQLYRANQKDLLLQSFSQRTLHQPFSANDLSNINDWRFYRAQLTGTFDNKHTFLLDNKILHGQVGYEVYTPFNAHGMQTPILVDRGFVPADADRHVLPKIHEITGTVTLTGMLNLPPLYAALGPIMDSAHMSWPLRIEFINLADIGEILHTRLFPYVLQMDPHDMRAYAIEWQITTMPPERHKGYAVQWFALALTLLILFVALNRV